MTIYEHMVRKAPENNRQLSVSETDHIELWLNGYAEDGWELVTTTYLSGIVHYVFRQAVRQH